MKETGLPFNTHSKKKPASSSQTFSPFQKLVPPSSILIIVIASIILAEVIAMVVLSYLNPMPYVQQIVWDATIMTVLIFPLIYFVVYRPLQKQIHQLSLAEQSLIKANQTVEEERQRLYALFDQLPAFVYLCDLDYHVRYANSTFVKLFGEPDGKLCFELVKNQSEPCETCLKGNEFDPQNSFQTEWISPDGKYYQVYHYPFHDHDNNLLLLKLGIDDTGRRKNELALIQSNELLERMFFDEHMSIAYMDREFNFLRVNSTYARSDGHELDYYVGKNHFELFPNPENEEIFKKVVETGEPYVVYEKPFEYPQNPERGVTYWDWTLQPVWGASGEMVGVVLSLLDVTERKQAEAETRLERGKGLGGTGWLFFGMRVKW